MKIAVIGATGTAGRKVVEQLKAQGHEAVELSMPPRPHPVKAKTSCICRLPTLKSQK
ncbi:MAG: SDR family oxidoreductase [Corynebacterium sp.]|uniref:SDR family oxidoreductase n=1 Tax=Corynebacterium TaxID=1716 RepID=UPI00178D1DCE|nr:MULTISPECIES: SDR family oxidoreductase [Corynebacterium]NWO17139.1 SDR family oxidoreductase [Corynebacterium sp.]WLP87809.1 SDR family oxidoreductase [Corynebacterium stationis]